MDWQHPFVDIFKQFGVFEIASTQAKGQVSVVQDNGIGRRIIRLQGSISSNNSVTIPDPINNTKSLGLSGRYIYIEFLPSQGRYFTIHFEILIKDRDLPIKLTISNMYDTHKVQQSQLNIPYPKNSPQKWTILILDVEYFLANFGLLPLSQYKSFKSIHLLKSFQICSAMNIRGIFTSDNLYDWETMPKQMLFKLSKQSKWTDQYQIAFWPTLDIQPQVQKQPLQELAVGIIHNLNNIQQNNDKYKQDTHKSFYNNNNNNNNTNNNPSTAPQQLDELVKKRPQHQPTQTKAIDAPDHPLQPYPIQVLDKVIGFTVRTCPDIKWGRQTENQKILTYAAGNLLVAIDCNDNSQKFFLGHSQPITCLDVSRDGEWLVSAQSGRNAVVRIWTQNSECLSAFATPYVDLINVAFSADRKLLVTTGADDHNREVLIVWGLENVLSTRKPLLYAKQTSSVNILCVKFSPVDNNRLISCGHENIRFWRIKEGHLPGASIVLNHHARNTTFAVFDFEFNYEEHAVANVYFGSKSGYLFQVNYNKQQLIQVFKVHNEAIMAVCVSAGFCVTGSLDQYLRVWPLDFSEFYIEAKHEGVITSLDMSIDGLQVACGTSTGGLGILDISSHHYKTVMRSHTATITQLEMHYFSNLLISLSEDCTIRLWDIQKSDQVYEFSFPQEDRCNVISACPNGMFFAAGFKSGIFRIFDIENTSIIVESKHHDSSIQSIQYSPDGKQLVVGEANSKYKIYDVIREYQPIKFIQSSLKSESYGAYSKDSAVLALIEGGQNIELWDTQSLQQILKVTTKYQLKCMKWAENNVELVCGMIDGRIVVYGIERMNGTITAYFLREQTFMHKQYLNDFVISPNMKYLISVGAEAYVKVWDYEFQIKGPGSSQIFIGHSSQVNSVAICDQGNTIITGGGEEGIFIWKFKGYTGKNERYLQMEQIVQQQQLQQQSQQLNKDQLEQEQDKQIEDDIQLLDDYDEVPQQQQQQQQSTNLVDMYSLARPIIVEGESPTLTGLGKQDTSPFKPDEFKPYRLGQNRNEYFDYERRLMSKSQSSRRKIARNVRYFQSSSRQAQNLPYRQFIAKQSPINECDIESSILIGYNNEGHDNIVWCRSQGWYAYTSLNYLIIEYLKQEREQKLIPLGGIVGVLLLDKNEKNLIVGMGQKCKDFASILIFQTDNLKLVSTLNFHTCGVNQLLLTEDNKYLLSIGNGKECTVVVWDYGSRKILTSSYTLERINDVRLAKCAFSKERIFEFASVGRDQIHFWAFTKECKLEYYDVFLPKNKQGQLEEITTFDYIYYNQTKKQESLSFDQQQQSSQKNTSTLDDITLQEQSNVSYKDLNQISSNPTQDISIKQESIVQLLVLGLQSGEIVIMRYGDFKILYRRFITQSEITLIRIYQAAQKIHLYSTEALFYQMELENILHLQGFLDSGFPFQKVNLPSMVCASAIEPLNQYGIFGLQNGTIYLINLQFKQIHTLVSSNGDYAFDINQLDNKLILPFTSTIIKQSQLIEDVYLINIHQGGTVKIWNIIQNNGELLMEYNWDKEIMTMMYDAQSRQVIFFLQFGQIKAIILDRLDLVDQFFLSQKQSPDTIKSAIFAMFDSIPARFVLDSSGVLYYYEQLLKNSEFIVRLNTILELQNVSHIVEQSEKKVIFVVEESTGIVNTLQVDYNVAREFHFGFTMFDSINFLHNPHGNLDNPSTQQDTQILYQQTTANTQVVGAKGFDNVYFAILDQLQYLYARNYHKKQTILLISLRDFPISLAVSDPLRIYIITQNGSIEIVNPNGSTNSNQVHFPQIDNPKFILVQKKTNTILLSNQSIMNLYNNL